MHCTYNTVQLIELCSEAMKMSDILTTKQAAEILEINPVSVIRAINRGRIEAVKFGVQWVIERDEVERYKQERRIKPKPKSD